MRIDWPGSGPLDLNAHDLPHNSSSIEWWYYNMHLVGEGACAFRSRVPRLPRAT